MAEGFATADKSKPYLGLNSIAKDRGYKDGDATATCLCGAVQLGFVSEWENWRINLIIASMAPFIEVHQD